MKTPLEVLKLAAPATLLSMTRLKGIWAATRAVSAKTGAFRAADKITVGSSALMEDPWGPVAPVGPTSGGHGRAHGGGHGTEHGEAQGYPTYGEDSTDLQAMIFYLED